MVGLLTALFRPGNRYRHARKFQLLLFALSITLGSRLIWIVNRANWKANIKQACVSDNNILRLGLTLDGFQCPPLATAWVLAIVALDLGPAAMSLVIIGIWAWWAGMKIAS